MLGVVERVSGVSGICGGGGPASLMAVAAAAAVKNALLFTPVWLYAATSFGDDRGRLSLSLLAFIISFLLLSCCTSWA